MVLKFIKRGTAQAKKAKADTKGLHPKRKGAAGPKERKIGIFGHTRAGKTVFLTMLWHQTHGRRDFSLETDDFQTRQDMSSYFDLLAAGQWPPPTATERLYRFTAVIDATIRYPFESQDYQGESVSIDREVETGKEFLEYFESCDAVFVLVDSEDLIQEGRDAAIQRRKKIDSFELMLAQLVEGTRNRLKIPVAIVVTKADLLDGFQGEDHVTLVGDDIRYSRYRGYSDFISAVLQQGHVMRHLPWRDQVEYVLQMLKPLVDYCLTKSPDLQIFFVSSTGGVEHVVGGEDEGATRPPKDLRPVGLERPFVWSVRILMEKRKALIARKIKWWVAGAAAVFIVIFSLFNLWHEGRVQNIRKLAGLGGVGGGSAREKVEALEGYRSSLLAGFFKPEFKETVDLILEYESARALSAKMSEAIESISYEQFSEARNAMRELRDQFPEASKDYQSSDRTLVLREGEWDRVYSEHKLEPLAASPQTQGSEMEHAIERLFRPENRRDWQSRWRQRQALTQDELRRQDLDQILRAVSGLGGHSWKALERVDALCKSYIDAYIIDVEAMGAPRTTYTTIREIEGLLGRALESQENPSELRGIASQLRGVGKIAGQAVGPRIADHLVSLGSEVMASNAGEALDGLIQDLDGGSLDFRFSEGFKSRLRRFTRNFSGTPEMQRVRAFLQKIEAVEKTGMLVKVEAGECPTGYHLRLWNHEANSWDPADVEPGLPGRLRWKPGDAIKVGLEKTDPHNVGNNILDEWEVAGRWSLFRMHEDGGRHVFRGNYPATVIFPDLETSLPRL